MPLEIILAVGFFAAGVAVAWGLTVGMLWAARTMERRRQVPAGAVVLLMVRSLVIAGLFVGAGLQGVWAGGRAGLLCVATAVGGYLLVRRVLGRHIRGQL
jgi:hypothetical protein